MVRSLAQGHRADERQGGMLAQSTCPVSTCCLSSAQAPYLATCYSTGVIETHQPSPSAHSSPFRSYEEASLERNPAMCHMTSSCGQSSAAGRLPSTH